MEGGTAFSDGKLVAGWVMAGAPVCPGAMVGFGDGIKVGGDIFNCVGKKEGLAEGTKEGVSDESSVGSSVGDKVGLSVEIRPETCGASDVAGLSLVEELGDNDGFLSTSFCLPEGLFVEVMSTSFGLVGGLSLGVMSTSFGLLEGLFEGTEEGESDTSAAGPAVRDKVGLSVEI